MMINRTIGSFFIALSTAAIFAGCADDPDAASAAATPDGIGTAATVTSAAWAQVLATPTTPGLAAAFTIASNNAAALVANRPAFLNASPKDAFVQRGMQSSSGLVYVPYERTYAGLPVVGGDFVMVIDSAGQLAYHSGALERPIDISSITPRLSQAAAETIATQRLHSVTRVEGTELVVNALGATPRLAWESTVNGFGANGISRLTVDVDALTGDVLREQEHVLYGTGTSAFSGPNPVALNTTQSGSTFSMRDPTITNLSCQDAANNTTFSGSDDLWGNGNATNRETGCVDALFGAQVEARMLTQWLGRNAFDGVGGGFPIRVGLNQVNAFYDGTQVQVGHNNANQFIGSIDVIAHELAHGIDDHSPGGVSGGGTQEFVADTFGAATEAFANEPAPFDVPDFTVGEQINLVGSGPIRNMANPSLLGDPNCFSSAIPTTEVHAAAGPGNHWFYLLAQGSNPTNGFPTSPTCNGSTVVGLGTQNAIKIMYNAMLMKTTGMSYPKYRTLTLQAAINLFPSSCTAFNTAKAAWDAISVPAQAGDPTPPCTPDFSLSASPTSRSVVQGASTTYTVTETPSGGFTGSVMLAPSGLPAGATASFSPTQTTGTSTLTVTTTTLPPGTYPIKITGTSENLSHTTTLTLVVTPPPSCGTNLLLNPGFETVGANWTATPGVLGNGGSAHTGTQFAWLDGYGNTHTDTLSQTVTIPPTCTAVQLCYFLKISTAETITTTQFDKLTVKIGSTTLGTFSNLNAVAFAGYTQVCHNVGSFAGTTQTVSFTGTEDSSLQTSFIIDDTSLQNPQ
jgi:Zn-dependent metalloprotease